jgi:NitT/TauT family transport system permease protein
LPGLVLGLIAIFPKTNVGLELAAIIMIFTGQVWNMTLSYYASLKSIPTDLIEASTVMGLRFRDRLLRLELPASAINLAWNSLISMAGGWFFLSVCESFTLGDLQFKLPGIGSYMATAIEKGDNRAMVLGVVAMVLLIVGMDFVIWRPILAWVRRFRYETGQEGEQSEPLMQIFLRESRMLRWIKVLLKRVSQLRRHGPVWNLTAPPVESFPALMPLVPVWRETAKTTRKVGRRLVSWFTPVLLPVVVVIMLGFGTWKLGGTLLQVNATTWVTLLRSTWWTFVRVVLSLIISTVWAVPAGIWIGTSARRIRIAQPIIQVLASFPAPMLYPLVLAVLFKCGMNFNWSSMWLMQLGVQWYILFNVLAGALRIPLELKYALGLMKSSRYDYWRTLYLPSVFPALVTGWVTAAGGAWNASIVAEYIPYRGQLLQTSGLGASISIAAANQDFPMLAASLTIMVMVVLVLNRTIWARVYHLAQTRFRMD